MLFDNSYLILKSYRAIALNRKLLRVRASKSQILTKIDNFRELVSKLTVDNWERMDGDEDLVPLAVDADGVVVVLIGLVASGGELHVDVLGNASRQHPFFLVPDLEEWRLRRQNVQPLRSR